MRSQIVTSKTGRGGRRYLPRVFTEQGVAMLSAVLRSANAVEVSVRVMDAFVQMRRFLAGNARLLDRVREVEARQLEYERVTDERLSQVFDYMDAHEESAQKVFFDGQVWDALSLLVRLVRQAERAIALVDGYVDVSTLDILSRKRPGVAALVCTYPGASLTARDVDVFNVQYPTLTVKRTPVFHDRFLILDEATVYHVGASFKDAGRKCFAIGLMEDPQAAPAILARINAA